MDLVSDTLGVLVLFATGFDESESYLSLRQNLRASGASMDLLVFDNSPKSQAVPPVSPLNPFKIFYEHHPDNPGLSKAYNTGYARAKRLNKNWLLLLDQDTVFPESTLEKYFEAVSVNPSEVLFVPILTDGRKIYSPCRYRHKKASHMKQLEPGVQLLRGKSVLNSGILIQVYAFDLVGKYNERLRLDFSDFDFIDRLRTSYQNFVVVNLYCIHQFFDAQSDLPKALGRFKIYAEGTTAFADGWASQAGLRLQLFQRMLVLTIRYKTLQFIKVLLPK